MWDKIETICCTAIIVAGILYLFSLVKGCSDEDRRYEHEETMKKIEKQILVEDTVITVRVK